MAKTREEILQRGVWRRVLLADTPNEGTQETRRRQVPRAQRIRAIPRAPSGILFR
jgi:hypothetical protein